jgi:hypothetical protein
VSKVFNPAVQTIAILTLDDVVWKLVRDFVTFVVFVGVDRTIWTLGLGFGISNENFVVLLLLLVAITIALLHGFSYSSNLRLLEIMPTSEWAREIYLLLAFRFP